jgi:tripartite-type tricarboxylate transporter receptor subunit TctC
MPLPLRSARLRSATVLLCASALVAACGGTDEGELAASGPGDFYAGKTITVVVGTSAGGTFDLTGRILARHLSKHLPGEPKVIVENKVGAGTMLAANDVASARAQDGTQIAHVNGGVLLTSVLGLKGPKFDASKLGYLGLPSGNVTTCVARTDTGVNSAKDLMPGASKREAFRLGSDNPGSLTYLVPAVAIDALKLNAKLATGYAGAAELLLALQQKEIDGYCVGWDTIRSTALGEMLSKGELKVLLHFAGDKPPAGMPAEAPSALALAPNDAAADLIRYGVVLSNNLLRVFFVGPDVPADRVEALRAAFSATLEDPAAKAEFEKAGFTLAPVAGKDVQGMLDQMATMPPAVADKVRKLLKGS